MKSSCTIGLLIWAEMICAEMCTNGAHQPRAEAKQKRAGWMRGLARLVTIIERANRLPQSVIQGLAGELRNRKLQRSVTKKRLRSALIKPQLHGHINVLLSIVRRVPELPLPNTLTLNLAIRKSPAGQPLQGLRDHSIILVRSFCLLALQLRLVLLFPGFSLLTAFTSK